MINRITPKIVWLLTGCAILTGCNDSSPLATSAPPPKPQAQALPRTVMPMSNGPGSSIQPGFSGTPIQSGMPASGSAVYNNNSVPTTSASMGGATASVSSNPGSSMPNAPTVSGSPAVAPGPVSGTTMQASQKSGKAALSATTQ